MYNKRCHDIFLKIADEKSYQMHIKPYMHPYSIMTII